MMEKDDSTTTATTTKASNTGTLGKNDNLKEEIYQDDEDKSCAKESKN